MHAINIVKVAKGAGGIAITEDGKLMASVDNAGNSVIFHSLLGPTTIVFGDSENASHRLQDPFCASFAHRNGAHTLLVSDCGNHRIVELTEEGRWIRSVAIDGRPSGVAYCQALDLIAVSVLSTHAVLLLQYHSGKVITTIGGFGSTDGKLNEPVVVHFSRDGVHIIVADYNNHCVSKFRISDGAFAEHLATRALHGIRFPMDFLQCDDGSTMVACNVFVTGSSETIVCYGSAAHVVENLAAWSFAHPPGSLFVAKTLAGRLVQRRDEWFTSSRSAWISACVL
jgi:hypothetical protein